jgi:hypothetical protein
VGVGAPTAANQRAALVELYVTTGGNSWSDKSGWQNYASGSDPCDDNWSGVLCAGVTTRNMYDSRGYTSSCVGCVGDAWRFAGLLAERR